MCPVVGVGLLCGWPFLSQTERTKNKLVCSDTNWTLSPCRFKKMSCFSYRLLLLLHIYVVWRPCQSLGCRTVGHQLVQLGPTLLRCIGDVIIWLLASLSVYVWEMWPRFQSLVTYLNVCSGCSRIDPTNHFFPYLRLCKPTECQLILCMLLCHVIRNI